MPRLKGEQDYRESPDTETLYRDEFPRDEDLEAFGQREDERSDTVERQFERRLQPGKIQRTGGGRYSSR